MRNKKRGNLILLPRWRPGVPGVLRFPGSWRPSFLFAAILHMFTETTSLGRLAEALQPVTPVAKAVVPSIAPTLLEAVVSTLLPQVDSAIYRHVFPGLKQNFLRAVARAGGQRLLRQARRYPIRRYAKSWRRPFSVHRKYRRKNLQFPRRRSSWKAKAGRSSSKMGSYVRWKKGVSHRSSRMGYRKRF